MSVFAHKADKSKFNLGNESDLSGIGDGTAFNAIEYLNQYKISSGNWINPRIQIYDTNIPVTQGQTEATKTIDISDVMKAGEMGYAFITLRNISPYLNLQANPWAMVENTSRKLIIGARSDVGSTWGTTGDIWASILVIMGEINNA